MQIHLKHLLIQILHEVPHPLHSPLLALLFYLKTLCNEMKCVGWAKDVCQSDKVQCTQGPGGNLTSEVEEGR